MKIRAQMGMVMNLDKCIGCHTCSVTCKNVWTNRRGTEYIWFNNVETKPGRGYPRDYEDQERWNGGWKLDRKGKLRLRAGGKLQKLLNIFWNPDLPDARRLLRPLDLRLRAPDRAPAVERQPVAKPHSQVERRAPRPGVGPELGRRPRRLGRPRGARPEPPRTLEEQVRLEFEQSFMMYLPRICEHCINPSCVASCPSGAMYKREEDGIVLVDQEACRSWRFCVSGCPYKKVYFNWDTGKAEKCNFCYPRIEAGLPTVCSETCVGRLRHLGIVLIDTDRVEAAASVPDEKTARGAARHHARPRGSRGTRAGAPRRDRRGLDRGGAALAGLRDVQAAGGSRCRCIPSTGRCRWSGTCRRCRRSRASVEQPRRRRADPDRVFATVEEMRIPVEYLAASCPPAIPSRCAARCARLAAMRDTCAPVERRRRRVDAAIAARGRDGARPSSRRCSGWSRSATTTTVTWSRKRHGEVSPRAFAEQGRAGSTSSAAARRRPRPNEDGLENYDEPLSPPTSTCATARAAQGTGAMSEPVHPLKLASLLLQYPSDELRAARRRRRAARSSRRAAPGRGACGGSAAGTRRAPAGELQRLYVETFDFSKQRSLHLTYHVHGDRRQRGMAMLQLKQAYAAAGFELSARRAARLPAADARVRRARPATPGASCSRARGRDRARPRRAAPRRAARTRRCSMRRRRRCPASAAASLRRCAGSPPRARRPSRSGSSRSRRPR